ncbi:MAG: PxKF domain-containing protein [Fimbriimonadaceae bacterium]
MRKLLSLATLMLVPGLALAQYTFTSLKPTFAHDQSFGSAIDGLSQAGYYVDSNFETHAGWWQGTGASFVDLHSTEYMLTQATGISPTTQVGFGLHGTSFEVHALMWSGSSGSIMNLTPSGSAFSICNGINGGQQVGYADFGAGPRAIIWAGSASLFTDVTPGALDTAVALCTSGSVQGGWSNTTGDNHATIWQGTAASAVDINPIGYTVSQVSATDGTNHGGFAVLGGIEHAAFWGPTGFVDLHPSGYQQSGVKGVAPGKQAGFGLDAGGTSHALVWSGTPGSMVDLNQFLPGGFTGAQAHGIDDNGNIVGVAFGGTSSGQAEAVVWKPVPAYQFIGFLWPINDPAVPESVFRKGIPVPLLFRLKDSAGANVPNVVAVVSLQMLGTTDTTINEEDFTYPCDNGVTFEYISFLQTYSFVMNTRHLQARKRYRVTATLSNGQTHSVTFSLR